MLKFGYNLGLPDGIQTAWGCRAIIDQDGSIDVPPDRIDAIGPDEPRRRLLNHLTEHVGGAWGDRARELLRAGIMNTRRAHEFVLYEDPTVMVKGNTHASAGYLYVCAYLKSSTAE